MTIPEPKPKSEYVTVGAVALLVLLLSLVGAGVLLYTAAGMDEGTRLFLIVIIELVPGPVLAVIAPIARSGHGFAIGTLVIDDGFRVYPPGS